MAISAVFTNHFAAVDACGELGEIGFTVVPGWDKTKGCGKKATQLVIDLPDGSEGQITELTATAEAIVAKYEGRIL